MRNLLLIIFCLMIYSNTGADTRIVGGETVKLGTFPWMVAIVYADEDAYQSVFCGGTLIHPSWVLTANHCILGETADDLEAIIGRNTLSNKNEGERIKIAEIINYPDYEHSDPDLPPRSDIALLRLATPSSYPVVKLADPFNDQLMQVGTLATVMGWGKTRANFSGRFPDTLQQVTLPIVSNATCNAAFGGGVQETMLCAGYQAGGKDACEGDSGSPLVVQENGQWYQVGIVSFGEECALPDFYGIYTRVSAFQDFITQHICQTEAIPLPPHLEVAINHWQATAFWHSSVKTDGYQFYYAPYSNPMSEVTLANIHSFDIDTNTSFSTELFSGASFYVAVRAYRGNCTSGYSNIGTVIIP